MHASYSVAMVYARVHVQVISHDTIISKSDIEDGRFSCRIIILYTVPACASFPYGNI